MEVNQRDETIFYYPLMVSIWHYYYLTNVLPSTDAGRISTKSIVQYFIKTKRTAKPYKLVPIRDRLNLDMGDLEIKGFGDGNKWIL